MPDEEELNIEEVSRMIGVRPHVLRYWETEFLQLTSERDEKGQQVYRRKDVDIIFRIRELLYEEKHTIASARKEIAKEFG